MTFSMMKKNLKFNIFTEPLKVSRPGNVTYELCFGRSGTLGGKKTSNAVDFINLPSGFELHR